MYIYNICIYIYIYIDTIATRILCFTVPIPAYSWDDEQNQSGKIVSSDFLRFPRKHQLHKLEPEPQSTWVKGPTDLIWVNLITASLRRHWESLVNKGNHPQMA